MAMHDHDPIEILDEGIVWYRFSDGTTLRAISGGGDGDDGDGTGDGDGDGDGGGDDGAGDGGSGSSKEDGTRDDGDGSGDDDNKRDWKSHARSWERKAKRALKERDELREQQKQRDDESKSEHEKAIEAAREEARNEARTEATRELRSERLSASVARMAAGRFADVDDALLRVEKAIRDGDIDEDDVFDDANKVQRDVIKTWLEDLLKEKPHLAGTGNGKVTGSSDAGRGRGGKSVDDMSVDDHLTAIKRNK